MSQSEARSFDVLGLAWFSLALTHPWHFLLRLRLLLLLVLVSLNFCLLLTAAARAGMSL